MPMQPKEIEKLIFELPEGTERTILKQAGLL